MAELQFNDCTPKEFRKFHPTNCLMLILTPWKCSNDHHKILMLILIILETIVIILANSANLHQSRLFHIQFWMISLTNIQCFVLEIETRKSPVRGYSFKRWSKIHTAKLMSLKETSLKRWSKCVLLLRSILCLYGCLENYTLTFLDFIHELRPGILPWSFCWTTILNTSSIEASWEFHWESYVWVWRFYPQLVWSIRNDPKSQCSSIKELPISSYIVYFNRTKITWMEYIGMS